MEDTNRLPEAVPIFRNAAKITLRLLGVLMGPFVNHLDAPGNYLRAARQLGITDEEIYQRLEADLPNRRRVKEQFQELWKVVLEQNPKESTDEQPAPLK